MKALLKKFLASVLGTMPDLIEKAALINTQAGSRYSSITITSHDTVCTLQIIPKTITSQQPAINVDFYASGTIVIFSDTGSGWRQVRTI